MTREERSEYMRKYRDEHREEWKDRHREIMRKYRTENLNKNGITKSQIRVKSGYILRKCHPKLPFYEIHHCFGYEDPNKFIYISRSLHLQIHQLLSDNNISADEDHWNEIRDLVNSCELYTYIRT